MAVLITGGAGFIGVALARRFAEEGNEVLAFDYSPPKVDLADALPEAIRFEQGDIRDAELVKSMVEQSGQKDVIIHLAGILTAGCDQDPNTGMAINVGGMHHVLDAATAQGSRRVVLASTIGVYGRGLPQPLNETMPTEPDGWYGYTKICAEQMGLLYQRRHGLDFRAVRYAAVTGPFRKAKGSASLFTSLIPEKAALGEAYDIEVTEDSAYPVVYIRDAVDAIYALATAAEAPHRIYNVASGRVVVSEMVEYVLRKIPDACFDYRPDPVIMQVVSGYRDWRVDCSRIAEDLGWRPTFGVQEMVDDIIDTVRRRKARP